MRTKIFFCAHRNFPACARKFFALRKKAFFLLQGDLFFFGRKAIFLREEGNFPADEEKLSSLGKFLALRKALLSCACSEETELAKRLL